MMTFDDNVITDYGMVGRIGSIEDINGEHVALTGDYEDIDKTMPVNQGIWRN